MAQVVAGISDRADMDTAWVNRTEASIFALADMGPVQVYRLI
jgi:hypothetical protein